MSTNAEQNTGSEILSNGAVLIERIHTPQGSFVLARTEGTQPFVTWQEVEEYHKLVYLNGHYFESIFDAVEDFRVRILRILMVPSRWVTLPMG